MKRYGLLLVGSLLLGSCGTGSTPAAQVELSGVVSEGRGQEAVAGATVEAVGLNLKAVTDNNGRWTLKVPGGRTVDLLMTKANHASALVQDLDVSKTTYLEEVLRPAFDPALTTVPGRMTVDLANGTAVAAGAELKVKIDLDVQDPARNSLMTGIASLEQPGGYSSTMNGSVVRHLFLDARGDNSVTFEAGDFSAYKGEVPVHFVAYDLNGNRTHLIRYVKVEPAAAAAAVVAPTDVKPRAITFADKLTYSPQSLTPRTLQALSSSGLLERAGLSGDLEPLAAPEQATLWVDVRFKYPVTAAAPRAFELWRSADGTNFSKIVTAAPERVLLDEETGSYRIRDTSSQLTAGEKVHYKVVAVSDAGQAESAVNDVTPLGRFTVDLLSPGQAATGVDLRPIFRWAGQGEAANTYYQVMVLDRIQGEGQSIAWLSEELENEHTAVYNFDGSAKQPSLQPYHAYEWELVALTVSEDGKAIAVGSDYFNLLGLFANSGASVQSAEVHEFVTGGR
ncbi:hypothetical protein ACFP81_12570 [Deinococcus lacus]|uniref:Carboxypeptidase regulatory-like domain-containing protein n=1 Tax=Deinococcus lacus TaxID=392561 RepID=A0ABW1YI18_9DEIO